MIEATSTIERTGSGRPTVRPGNVHSSGGNVQFAGKLYGPTPRTKPDPEDSHCDDHHRRRRRRWPPKYTFIHIHDDDPPWEEVETVVVVHIEPQEQVINDRRATAPQKTFIPRSQISDAVITVELPLTRIEWQRAQALISRGIIRNVLDGTGAGLGYDYELDARWSRLNLTAPSEQVAVIETMIRDFRTFQAMTQPSRYGYSAAIVPVVSPFYLESDARAAAGLAGENFDAIRRMLQEASWRYAYSGKACWLNAGYGTVTIVDERENIQRAIALMNDLPFVPRDMVHE